MKRSALVFFLLAQSPLALGDNTACAGEETVLLGDIHKKGDIANIEGDTTARQLQEEVGIAHQLIKGMSLDQVQAQSSALVEAYRDRIRQTLTHLPKNIQEKLLATVYSSEDIQEALLLEYALGNHAEEARKVQFYDAAAVLDRPLIDHINIDALTKRSEQQGVAMKETLLKDYDEALVNQAFFAILAETVNSLHDRLGVEAGQKLRFTAQIHRGGSGVKQMQTLRQMLRAVYGVSMQESVVIENKDEGVYKLRFENNVELILRNGYREHTLKGYLGSAFVISLGLVVGLSPEISSGRIVVPSTFLRFDQKTLKLYESEKRYTANGVREVMQLVFADEALQAKIIQVIRDNKAFQSQKGNSTFLGKALSKEDFAFDTTLLMINDIWNPEPEDEQKLVTIL